MNSLDVLYRDDHCIAVNKPAGLLVHRSQIDRHETQFAVQLLRDQIGKLVYPAHRLDKPTSGILLFGLTSAASAKLCEDFRERRVRKQYLALVRGHCPDHGRLDRPLDEHPAWTSGRKRHRSREPQSAETCFHTLDRTEVDHPVGRYPTGRYSLLGLEPATGRRHQLRRHLKHAAHPIIGDTTHGDHRHNRFFRDQFGLQRMLLAAVRLEFPHPASGERVTITAPPGTQFSLMLHAVGIDRPLADLSREGT